MTADAKAIEDLMRAPPFSLKQAEKEQHLLPLLKDLTQYHRAHCEPYGRIVDLAFPGAASVASLADLPYLPISLFKFRTLRSVPDSEVRVTVSSSGTSSMNKSRIDLDAATARLSAKALSLILSGVTGGKRLPMLIVDCEEAVRGRDAINARASAILGLMPYGRDHVFALRGDMSVDEDKVRAFLKTHGSDNILIYGFTFLIWKHFIAACEKNNFDFARATLLHSGGWKKLIDEAVDNAAFKVLLMKAAKIAKVMNFYGMAELPGTIFLEQDDGLLYPPHFADVIIRDPITFQPLPPGKPGLIQIVTALAHSYPGQSLLTEDMGVVEAVDKTCNGRGLRILGRAPRAELRGCSDVLALKEQAA